MIFLSRKELYALFLECDWWANLSRIKRESVGRCESCPATTRLQAHHVRYPRHWFDTALSDLKVLCRDCHKMEHGIQDIDSGHGMNDKLIPVHAFTSDPNIPRNLRKKINRRKRKWNPSKKARRAYVAKWRGKVASGSWSH